MFSVLVLVSRGVDILRISFWLSRLFVLSVELVLIDNSSTWADSARLTLENALYQGLPDLTIEFSEEGKVKLFSIPLWWMPGLDEVGLDPETVARVTNSNVQHIHLDYHSSGLAMLADGQPILDFRYEDHDQLWSILNGLSVFMGEQGGAMLSNARRFSTPYGNSRNGNYRQVPHTGRRAINPYRVGRLVLNSEQINHGPN